jgi:hypothetical protein
MALTLEEFKTHQNHKLSISTLALWYAERGEDALSRDLLTAALRASKIRPTKETPAAESASVAVVTAVKPTKEKAA